MTSVAPKKHRRTHVRRGNRAVKPALLLPPPCYEHEPYRLTFFIEALPKTPNSLLGAKWPVRAGHATKWDRLIHKSTLGMRPLKPLAKAKLTLTRSSSKPLDYEGLVGSFKAPIDALVKNGILLDDSMAAIGAPTYLHEVGKRGGGFIKIEVEEV